MLENLLSRWPSQMRRLSLPTAVLRETKIRLLDSFGCFIAAYDERPVRVLRETITAQIQGPSLLWGTRRRVPPTLAAWANGAAVRALDYNDTYLSLEPCHPSDMISSLWAACEQSGATREGASRQGRTLLEAIALSYEVLIRLCDAASIRRRGWDHVTYLPIATAVGCAYIFGLNPEKTRHAIALSATGNNALRQTRVGTISDWKAACAAYAASAGLWAALLARQGFTGPADIFAGRHGFFAQVSGRFSFPSAPLGRRWGILRSHLKFFPAEHHAQSAIEAALAARTAIKREKISSVRVDVFDVAADIIGSEPEKWRPTTRETADHSLPYLIAVALLDGEVTLGQYRRRRFQNPAVRQLMRRVRVQRSARYSSLYPRWMPTRLVITLSSGRTLTKEVLRPKGYAGRPMTDEDVAAKFNTLTRGRLSERARAAVVNTVLSADRLDKLDRLGNFFLLPEKK